MNRFVIMDSSDMVATALVDLKAKETAHVYTTENEFFCELLALTDIPYGNKIALVDIQADREIIKYGSTIGLSTKNIKKGEIVHVHNVKSCVVDIPPAFKKEIIKQMNIEL